MKTKGRYAPSPTGRMHLGNVFSALLSYLMAKRGGGVWLLRIEDLDVQRCRYEYARLLEEDLQHLGLVWDEGGLDSCRQSTRGEIYAEALERLKEQTYPCFCTRADLMQGRHLATEEQAAAGAPHDSDGRVIYPGTCRNLPADKRPAGRNPAIRLMVPDKEIRFTDGHFGPQCFNLARDCGDFILRRSDGIFAYQLAVVADDALMGVNQVVRGRDLLLSTAQQIHLYGLLGYPVPEFFHTPLLCAPDGRRLCKRDLSTDMGQMLRQHSPEEIIGKAAHLAGILPKTEPCKPQDLLPLFNPDRLPVADIIPER